MLSFVPGEALWHINIHSFNDNYIAFTSFAVKLLTCASQISVLFSKIYKKKPFYVCGGVAEGSIEKKQVKWLKITFKLSALFGK